MQCYMVGGAVRDALLGLPVKDHDWVVVGASPEEMLADGFKPVGKDFPVFLHPRTGEEYALARTERKTGRGYAGFAFHAAADVTLEQDLLRRDLTINAMARTTDGELIDPYGGLRDLEARLFRHVSPAFTEDPVRILRVARFAARLHDFAVAPETLALMRTMVDNGEVDHLVPERVWQEFARGLMEDRPSRMIEVLRACGALARLLPELDRLFGVPQPERHHPEVDTGTHVLLVIDAAARAEHELAVRWACLLHDLGKGDTAPEVLPAHHGHEASSARHARAVSARLKAPNDCRDLAELFAREHVTLHRGEQLRPATVVKVLERCDAFRRPRRFEHLLEAAACDLRGRGGMHDAAYPVAGFWRAALAAAQAIDAASIARECADRKQIPERIHAARVSAVKHASRSAAAHASALGNPDPA